MKVSICIPTYNQTVYLKRVLDSVLVQTFQDYEIVISDDTPDTLVYDFIKHYDFKGRLKYIKNEQPLGSPENWNAAIRQSTGDYIKILHHDDWFTYNDSLEKYVKLLDNDIASFIGFSSSFVLFPNGESRDHITSEGRLAQIQKHPENLFFQNSIGSPSAVIFRRNIFEYFDTNLIWLVDLEFYIRLIKRSNKISYAPETLITTFCVDGRISDRCIDDPKIQLFEHFYLFKKFNWKSMLFTNPLMLKQILSFLIMLCRRFNVVNYSQAKKIGFAQVAHPLFFAFFKRYLVRQ